MDAKFIRLMAKNNEEKLKSDIKKYDDELYNSIVREIHDRVMVGKIHSSWYDIPNSVSLKFTENGFKVNVIDTKELNSHSQLLSQYPQYKTSPDKFGRDVVRVFLTWDEIDE